MNIPLITFAQKMLAAGNLSVKGMVLVAVYYLKLILVLPGTFLQYLFYAKKIKRTNIDKDPVFIIGHYRSGTTYLHKLMACDDRFGFITYYDIICPNTSLLFGKWLQQALQFLINSFKLKTAFFNDTIPSLAEPAEEERFLINRASAYADYWRFVFPLNHVWKDNFALEDREYHHNWKKEYTWLLKLITYKNKGRQLVLKSPPNTERIKCLLELFPHAKFIYINRNPYHVFYSMQNLWKKALRKFCPQSISDNQIEEIIFNYYEHLVEQYEQDKQLIPAGNLVEVRYEDLEAEPCQVLENIYNSLRLPDFDTVNDSVLQQLQKEKKYCKFRYEYKEVTLKKIEKRWRKYIHKWNEKINADTHEVDA